MAGSVAVAAGSIDEALKQLEHAESEKVDLVKLMITGGVLDAKEKGVPGELKMKPEMVKAVCDKAHAAGYKVAAHVESPEGVKVALENGVDSIEHGAKPDDEMLRLFKEKNAFLCTTISPAVPYALFDRSLTNATEVEQYNGNIVFEGIVECSKAALANDIPVVLGNDVGCPWITQYDFWRELCYFHKYTGVSNAFALYTATKRSAELAGIGDVTGSIEVGKCADMIVTKENPLDNLAALRNVDMDRKIKENNIHFCVFCSPHNPCGRVWEKEEIQTAMEIYKDNQCIVVSDEIWSDIILDGHKHIPTQSVSEDAKNRTIAVYAPSKFTLFNA